MTGKKSKNAGTAPPSQRLPMNTDKKTAIASPIKASNCGVLRMNDFISAGKETKRIRTAIISSIRNCARDPNRVVGVRYNVMKNIMLRTNPMEIGKFTVASIKKDKSNGRHKSTEYTHLEHPYSQQNNPMPFTTRRSAFRAR
jgi:hypothetical protein